MAKKLKSSFGWHPGQPAGYDYRSAKDPEGTVANVTPGTTRANATVRINPAPGYRFGEGQITRHMDKIHHISGFSARARAPVKKKAAA